MNFYQTIQKERKIFKGNLDEKHCGDEDVRKILNMLQDKDPTEEHIIAQLQN